VRNAQRRIRIDREALEEFCGRALAAVRRLPRRKAGVLHALDEMTVILVSDQRMAAVHQQFLKTAGPTDVITFQDGDIFVSVETAKRNARRFGTSLRDEIRLYVVHGLLHLHGFDDTTPAKSRVMDSIQRRIFNRLSTTRNVVRPV
jgi:probable rRNA maturation factor